MLPTALIKVAGSDGKFNLVCAMFDQGSQLSLVSSILVKRFQLTMKHSNFKFSGIGSDYNKLVQGESVLDILMNISKLKFEHF